MGAYRTDEGKPYILDCVKKAEEKILADKMDHEYSGIDGIPTYRANCMKLAYGPDSPLIKDDRLLSC